MAADQMTTCAFKMVLIFSDRRGSELASRAAANLVREFDEGDCAQTSWKTELLRSPKLRMLAAREAADADLVIIALEEGSTLPQEIADWLALWRRRTRRRRSTLSLLARRAHASTPPIVEESLHAFAESTGMDFFCHSRVEAGVGQARSLEARH